MGYRQALEGVRDHIVSSLAGFTIDNCKIGDEAIFSYIQSENNVSTKAVLISPEPFNSGSRTEFMSSTVFWSIGVNAFFMIEDSALEDPLMDAIDFVDELIISISADSSLGGAVHSAKLERGGPLMTYARGNYYYFLMPVTLRVIDNLS